HGEGHAVLHAAGRIQAFELDQDPRTTVGDDALELEQRRATDALQDGSVDPRRPVSWADCWLPHTVIAEGDGDRACRIGHCMYLHLMYIHVIMIRGKRASRKTLVADAQEMTRVCAGTNIRLAARRITRFLEARMQETELSLAQFGLMAHIAAAGDDTIGALADRSGLDQSTLSRNLRGLEQDGLVEIAVVETD